MPSYITPNGIGIDFVGRYGFEQCSDPVWSQDCSGLDTARVAWQGAVIYRKEFEVQQARWAPMPNYDRMFLRSLQCDGERIFPTVELTYVGIRNGSDTPPITRNTYAQQTVSVSAGSNLRATFSYYAARTSYEWFEAAQPAEDPRYLKVLSSVNPFNNIFQYKIEDSNGNGQTVDLQDFIILINHLSLVERVTEYAVEEVVPKRIWRCASSADRLLTEA